MKSSWCQANLFFFFTCKFFPKSQITNKFFENEVVLEFQLPQVRGKKKSPFSYNMVIRMYVAMYRHTHTHTHTFDLSRGDYEIIVKALPSLALIVLLLFFLIGLLSGFGHWAQRNHLPCMHCGQKIHQVTSSKSGDQNARCIDEEEG